VAEPEPVVLAAQVRLRLAAVQLGRGAHLFPVGAAGPVGLAGPAAADASAAPRDRVPGAEVVEPLPEALERAEAVLEGPLGARRAGLGALHLAVHARSAGLRAHAPLACYSRLALLRHSSAGGGRLG
jgi:hypothetical protein